MLWWYSFRVTKGRVFPNCLQPSVLILFLFSDRVTKSPFAELIPEYVRAQRVGEGKQAPGECFPYYKACPKSIFKALANKYSAQAATTTTRDKTTTTTTTTRPVGEYQEQQAVLLPNSPEQDQEQQLDHLELNGNAVYM